MASIFGDKPPCPGCEAKAELIEELKELLREANKTALAAVDARAFAIRYPNERKVPQRDPRVPAALQQDPRDLAAAARGEVTESSGNPYDHHWTPGRGQSFEEIEDAFRLQQKAAGANDLDPESESARLDATALELVEKLRRDHPATRRGA